MPDRLRSPQGGGGRRRSPRGGGDDRRSSQDDEFGRRRSPHGAATRAGELPRAALSEFRVGQEVEYLSSTYNEWIEGKVLAINADGTLDLDVREAQVEVGRVVWRHVQVEAADPSSVRHVDDQRSPNRRGRRSPSPSPSPRCMPLACETDGLKCAMHWLRLTSRRTRGCRQAC